MTHVLSITTLGSLVNHLFIQKSKLVIPDEVRSSVMYIVSRFVVRSLLFWKDSLVEMTHESTHSSGLLLTLPGRLRVRSRPVSGSR